MIKKKIKIFFLLFVFFIFNSNIYSQIIILSDCKNLKDVFVKNEYILDLKSSLMTRNYIYDDKTYKKYRITDLSTKKENSIEHFIYLENGLILTDKIGYPLFYTQLIFDKNKPIIKIKTVINNEIGISTNSTCAKVEIFERES
jgi:hypothetical protein|tara:strand:+ start:547 stop:975 length:429 start_codon:yes stop_codon:yes gene_type:complete